jgi:secondary thiamine-phosphate synthase enzyme
MIFNESLTIKSSKKHEVIDITERIIAFLKARQIDKGLLNLWTVHTTAALTVNENDKSLWVDFLDSLSQIAPLQREYHHKPNAHAHILSAVLKPEFTIPINQGKMVLGTWQRILFVELDGPRRRTVKITIIGEKNKDSSH